MKLFVMGVIVILYNFLKRCLVNKRLLVINLYFIVKFFVYIKKVWYYYFYGLSFINLLLICYCKIEKGVGKGC